MNGILFLNKPKDWTSRDVVNKISSIYHTKKVGHTGTLDPMATGVLILCVGSYTKLVEELTLKDKTYLVTMKLGIKTDTKDITGKIIEEKQKEISNDKIMETFKNFPKEYIQTVPVYSAVKIDGKKLYEYAREGIKVKLPTRKVNIFKLDIVKIKEDEITFETCVSKGTYIRSLVEDIASNLDTIATMTSLTRIKQGEFSIENCKNIQDIDELTPLKKIEDLFHYPRYEINEVEYKRVLNGNKISLNSKEKRLFLIYQNEVIAIYENFMDEYKLIFKVI